MTVLIIFVICRHFPSHVIFSFTLCLPLAVGVTAVLPGFVNGSFHASRSLWKTIRLRKRRVLSWKWLGNSYLDFTNGLYMIPVATPLIWINGIVMLYPSSVGLFSSMPSLMWRNPLQKSLRRCRLSQCP